jgi:CDP-diacylglycerol--serine O-phosphatidyltransferase
MNLSLARPGFIVPHAITACNLFLGFYSITEVIHGKYSSGAACILVGAVLDLCDGALARHLNVASAFGKEFDSLADLAAFGLAPAILLYQHYYASFGLWGLMLSFLPLLCAALRLARFNTQSVNTYVVGLPAPAAASLIVSYSLYSDIISQAPDLRLLVSITVCTCLLMVSSIRFLRIKRALPVGSPQLSRESQHGRRSRWTGAETTQRESQI